MRTGGQAEKHLCFFAVCQILNDCSDDGEKGDCDNSQYYECKMGSYISDISEEKPSKCKEINPENIPYNAE